MKSLVAAVLGFLMMNSVSADYTTNPWDASSTHLVPQALFGIILAFVLISFLLFGMCQMKALQTPSTFADKPIDFGKIEK